MADKFEVNNLFMGLFNLVPTQEVKWHIPSLKAGRPPVLFTAAIGKPFNIAVNTSREELFYKLMFHSNASLIGKEK
jgi:hypothetical protein